MTYTPAPEKERIYLFYPAKRMAATEHATLTSKNGASHRVSLLAQYRDYSDADGPPEPGYRLSEYRMEDGKVTGIRESDWVVDSVQIYKPEVPEGAYCFEFVVCLCSHQPHDKEWSDAPFATDDHPVGTYDQAHEEFLRTMGLRPDQFPYVRTWFR
ncbi:hypothetical protein Lepto7375DRAFT_1821 [Leptolyngbya sp. PCC 7375]|nr:hypothetical protein Lepto7375DRAFT_1821 [Leptolyngbya sp. PCC 7375]